MDLGGQSLSDETLVKSETTRILRDVSGGNRDALNRLIPVIYRDRRLARHIFVMNVLITRCKLPRPFMKHSYG
jgi:hypothetical protein